MRQACRDLRSRKSWGCRRWRSGALFANWNNLISLLSSTRRNRTVLNLLGNVVASEDVAFTDISNGPQCVREICAQIDELIEKTELPSERIVGVGFTCAAGIDSDQGVVTSGGYLGWQAFDFTELAEALLKRSVTLNNIADALLQAETFSGCARDQTAVVLVHCSTGLAASFSSNGELISGASHRAGRLGHFPAAATTLSCSCGGSSCLNCSASGWSALIDLGIVDSPVYQPEQVQTYAHEIARLIARSHANDDSATAPDGLSQSTINDVLLRTGQALGEQLCLLELTFDPDKLILAGTLASNNSFYEGVLTGLKHSGQFGTALAEKVSRSRLLPVTGAGISALLSTIFAPDLDLERLAGASTAAGDNNSDTK